MARLGREAIVGQPRTDSEVQVKPEVLWPDSEEEVGCRIQRQGNFAATGVCSDRLLEKNKYWANRDRLAP